jgi:hypothetical protein
MADLSIGTPPHHPDFSTERYLALCNELKQLYVSITRAKQELIIFDQDQMVLWHTHKFLILSSSHVTDISTNA